MVRTLSEVREENAAKWCLMRLEQGDTVAVIGRLGGMGVDEVQRLLGLARDRGLEASMDGIVEVVWS